MRALIAALALWTATALAFTGRVVAIADGDTLTVMDGKAAVRVRLAGIDAPEHGQCVRVPRRVPRARWSRRPRPGTGGTERFARQVPRGWSGSWRPCGRVDVG